MAPARHKGAHGGRGSGKSTFFATYLLLRCLEQPGLRALCIREVQNSIKDSSKKIIEDWIENLGVEGAFVVKQQEIITPGGGQIIFRGMQNHTQQQIKSIEGVDICWVDEAHAISQASLDILIPTIRREGSELWYSWNPIAPTDPIDALLRGQTRPDSIVVEANWSENPFFPEVLRGEMEWDKSRNEEKYAHTWCGEYQKHSEARVFRNVEVFDFITPPGAEFYFGADWGFSMDPTVLVRCYIDARTLYIDQEAYRIGCEIDHIPFLFGGTQDESLQALNAGVIADLPADLQGYAGIPGSREWPIIGDSASPDIISHLRRHGFPRITAARKGTDSVREGVTFLQNFESIVVHTRCVHAIDEFRTYSHKIDKLTGEVLPILEDKKNHYIDSVRYALERVRRGRTRMFHALTGDPM